MTKHYRVGNPLEIPSNYHILRYMDKEGVEYFYYEDDLMTPPDGMKAQVVEEWLNRGFLVERKVEATNG